MAWRSLVAMLAGWGLAVAGAQPARWTYEVVGTHGQDPTAFTQGLCLDGKVLFLGTGQYGSSSIRRVDLGTGKTLERRDLDQRMFGEGVAKHGGSLYQLTWKSGVVLRYDAETLELQGTRRYEGEGWGLTSNGKELIMSNGTDVLTWRDPETFAVRWQVGVTMNGLPVGSLNELEYIKGRIFANVWQREEIVVINPSSGEVEATIDCSALVADTARRVRWANVLNGIAYDEGRNLVLVTGKFWDRIYALRVGGK